ncbi:50S ribosomal protein L10e [uncultured archaeon]|nr:50S ribosomal protein L10e [uncultured archaeon]
MGLRPAKCYRKYQGQPWTRMSRKKPRKSFVKGAPNPKIRQYNMGVDKRYEIEVVLVAAEPIQLRDNAVEAARQAANKHLEKNYPGNYFMQILKYPHMVIREANALGVAGADRISKGMKLAFGKPKGRMLRIKEGEKLIAVRTIAANISQVRHALDKAGRKLSGSFKITVRDITKDSQNLKRSIEGIVFKTKEIEKPVAVVAATTTGSTTTTEGTPAAPGATAAPAEKTEKKK